MVASLNILLSIIIRGDSNGYAQQEDQNKILISTVFQIWCYIAYSQWLELPPSAAGITRGLQSKDLIQ